MAFSVPTDLIRSAYLGTPAGYLGSYQLFANPEATAGSLSVRPAAATAARQRMSMVLTQISPPSSTGTCLPSGFCILRTPVTIAEKPHQPAFGIA